MTNEVEAKGSGVMYISIGRIPLNCKKMQLNEKEEEEKAGGEERGARLPFIYAF